MQSRIDGRPAEAGGAGDRGLLGAFAVEAQDHGQLLWCDLRATAIGRSAPTLAGGAGGLLIGDDSLAADFVLVRFDAGQDDGLAAARFADIQERIASAERRLTEVRTQIERLRRDLIDEDDAARALAAFDPVWETLSPREQARLLQFLIERVDYDGRDGTISITFHPSGIKALAGSHITGDAA